MTVKVERPMLALIRPSKLGTRSELHVEGLTFALIRLGELSTRSELEGLTLALYQVSWVQGVS